MQQNFPPESPLDLLFRTEDPQKSLRFFQALEEEIGAATADAVRTIPEAIVPSAKQARGTVRRHFLERAIRRAGSRAGIEIGTGWTAPPTWSYPTVRLGAFTIVLGLVVSRYQGAPRQLRTRSAYVEALCARNAPLDRQGTLFKEAHAEIPTLIPDGAFGGLIVSEHNGSSPEIPSFSGFWVPSNDLKKPYYCYSLEQIMIYLRETIAEQKPARKQVRRLLPQLKKKPAPKGK